MSKLRIFLADDHAVVREGLKRLVESQTDMEVIGEAQDGREAIQKAVELRPDIMVIDVSMPELNGAQATRQLKQSFPKLAVLALTVHEDKSYLRELLEAGASGYVLKRTAADELIHAIRAVAAGGVYVDPHIAGKLVSTFIQPRTSITSRDEELSGRESEVLRLIAQGYSNKEIGAQLELSIKTVETYKARSMEKLGLHSRVDIVRYAAEQDWLQPK
jgi:DNA-binding NarL/FixJ family response regulator